MLYTNNFNSPKVQHKYQSDNSSSDEAGLQQSSCSQCKRNALGIREQEDEDESQFIQRRRHNISQSSLSNGQLSSPMQKIKIKRNQELQGMLISLQYEVNKLKKDNEMKDQIIKELKLHVHKGIVQEEKRKQTDRQMNEINRVRLELGCSPRNQHFGLQSRGFRAVGTGKQIYNTARSFSKSHQPNTYDHSESMMQSFNPKTRPYIQESIIPLSTIPQSQTLLSSEYQLKLALLQKQLRQYEVQNIKQKHLITQLEQENKWQQKFILSFVKMCDQLSLNYGEKLKLNKFANDLKKQTKLSWNYMKNLVAYFIDSLTPIGSNQLNYQ